MGGFGPLRETGKGATLYAAEPNTGGPTKRRLLYGTPLGVTCKNGKWGFGPKLHARSEHAQPVNTARLQTEGPTSRPPRDPHKLPGTCLKLQFPDPPAGLLK